MISNDENYKFVKDFNLSLDSFNMGIDVNDEDDVETCEERIELDLDGWVAYKSTRNSHKHNPP